MDVKPLYSEPVESTQTELNGLTIHEPTVEALKKLLGEAKQRQLEWARTPVEERITLLAELGNLWSSKTGSEEWGAVKQTLSESTGYSRALIEEEFRLVAKVFNEADMRGILDHGLAGDSGSLDGFTEHCGEGIKHMPVGPVMIISSGNSVIPPLIPTVTALLTGNMVLLKPSLSNFVGLSLLFRLLEELEGAEKLRRCLFMAYMTHECPGYDYLLREAELGVVNFWGANPAMGIIGGKLGGNPNHPRYLINGPLTGFAIVKESHAEEAAGGFALNVVLYDQQLCSSPTQAAFIGSQEACTVFIAETAQHLDMIGGAQPIKLSEGANYMLQGVRRTLMMKGSRVTSGKNPLNPWTVVQSEGSSRLGEAMDVFPQFNLYARKRFIEVVRVDTFSEAVELIRDLPGNKAWGGVEKVQTIGALELSDEEYGLLAETGAYRIVCLGDMYMRSPMEPFDGVSLPEAFTYKVYRRRTRLTI